MGFVLLTDCDNATIIRKEDDAPKNCKFDLIYMYSAPHSFRNSFLWPVQNTQNILMPCMFFWSSYWDY